MRRYKAYPAHLSVRLTGAEARIARYVLDLWTPPAQRQVITRKGCIPVTALRNKGGRTALAQVLLLWPRLFGQRGRRRVTIATVFVRVKSQLYIVRYLHRADARVSMSNRGILPDLGIRRDNQMAAEVAAANVLSVALVVWAQLCVVRNCDSSTLRVPAPPLSGCSWGGQ